MLTLVKSDYVKLVPILALAFYMAFIPNLNYPYVVHIDEWVHLAYSKALLQAHDATFIDPFLGQATVTLSSNLETGFQLFWGVFHQISGLSWMTIIRFSPGIIFMMTVLSTYVLARRQGFGWEAALFTCLIPTTVGIMGPAFLIPVAMGLLFVPLALFIVFNFRTWWAYLALLVLVGFLVTMHPPSALLLIMVITPFVLLNLRNNFKHILGIALVLVLPFLLALPWLSQSEQVIYVVKSFFIPKPLPPYHDLYPIIQTYGYLPILFSLLGVFLLAIKGDRKNYGLIFGLLVLLLMLAIFYSFHYGNGILYLRGLLFMMLMLGIVAGAGLMGVRKLRLSGKLLGRFESTFLARNMGNILGLALIGLTLVIVIPDRQETTYYRMIDQADYQAFVWIRDNVTDSYRKAVLDPWQATAFTAITDKNIYTRTHVTTTPSDREAREFLSSGCTDTDFLRENDISIVYTRRDCNNPELAEVRKNVYLLKEATTE